MDTVWITGAKGFIGRHLARRLSHAGNDVHGIGHGLWPDLESREWGVSKWVNGDVDAAGLETLKRSGGPPARVFHTAGGSSVGASLTNPAEDHSRTVGTTSRLLEWMRTGAPDAQLIVLSSAAVYGSTHPAPIAEDSSPDPVSPYGYHKLMMEQLCQSYSESFGLRCTAVRLFSVYGPWLRKQLLWDLCSRLAQGSKVLSLGGTGNELRDWIEIRDVTRLLEFASSFDCPGFVALNGGSGSSTPVSEVARLVIEAWGVDVAVGFTGEARAGDPFSLVAKPGRIADRQFRWEVPLHEGIPNYVRWFKDLHGHA